MTGQNKAITLLLFFFLGSCSYKLADKHYVIQDQKGYLVFTQDEVNFYPSKDTIDTKFLADNNKKEGYRLGFDTNWLDSLSTDYSYATERKYPKKFSIIPVEVRSYLGNAWQKESEKNTFTYWWDNQLRTLRYKVYDFRSIIHIAVVRERDVKRLDSLKSSGVIPTLPHW